MNALTTAVLGGSLLLSTLFAPVHAQAQAIEDESSSRLLCFQVEALLVRARQQARELRNAHDRICADPTATGEECLNALRRQEGGDLRRLHRYRYYGNQLRREYGDMCNSALNETLAVIVETLEHVGALSSSGAGADGDGDFRLNP